MIDKHIAQLNKIVIGRDMKSIWLTTFCAVIRSFSTTLTDADRDAAIDIICGEDAIDGDRTPGDATEDTDTDAARPYFFAIACSVDPEMMT